MAPTKAVLHTQTGVRSYDRAEWSLWIPELSHVRSEDGLGSVYQRVTSSAQGNSITEVPPSPDLSLLFWTKGQSIEAGFNSTRRRFPNEPWDYTVLPGGCPSAWVSTPTSADGAFHLHIDASLLNRIAQEEGRSFDVPLLLRGKDALVKQTARWLFEELSSEMGPTRLLWTTAGATLAMRLLSSPVSAKDSYFGGLAPWQLRRVREYLEAHVADDLPLAMLAELVGLSSNHFCTAFRISLGEPPHRYLIKLRLERARELLADRCLSITEVALAVGFNSSAHFATAFRKQTGVAPSTYRQDCLS